METFTGFIEDDRYSTPTVMFFMAQGEAHAREIANGNLSANPHHLTVEVRDRSDELVFVARRGELMPAF